jgi:small subunit ribosomal protein S6
MTKYELVLVLPGNLEKNSLISLSANLKKIIEAVKAKILKEENWGVKKMAYPIKKTLLGQYLFWEIEIENSKIKELRRLLNFETKLLRYMLLKIQAKAKK